MGKVNIKDYGNICKWFKKLSNKKPMPLLPENKNDRLKKFTNFSLYHIMDKYEFLPNFILQTEYLYPILYKNPEILKQSYFNHHKFSNLQNKPS
ncbi:conserved Plasmodium protein, unknown function [Plasmodium gallinaceum]|uniref:Uncharacterized protein n=1 Tax=Plasmodium gallinaceum TaxID=5849 RepID=A0A1J1GN00_PLAGA|nr:conserved Plasmodium protein, unknown function [Plasmodium gallinaceum]CRG93833.1 conserved Plasmodium protein, unknown function [Plasmodium gallinaceum]